jgi:hypothetical protein
MTGLILLLVIGIVLAILFAIALFRGAPKPEETRETARIVFEVVDLPGLNFKQAGILFDDSDYRILHGVSALKNIAWNLRRDRRRLALLWLKLLRKDLSSLWRFRRLLASYGASAGPEEELGVATAATLGFVMLWCLSAVILIGGPFVLPALMRSARYQVQKLSLSCARLLGRIPQARWGEIQDAWTIEASG